MLPLYEKLDMRRRNSSDYVAEILWRIVVKWLRSVNNAKLPRLISCRSNFGQMNNKSMQKTAKIEV